MTNLDCGRIRDLLPEWVLGESESDSHESVREHLSVCPECSAEESVLRTLLASRPEPPPGLSERIQSRVREEFGASREVESATGNSGVVPLFRRRRWAPAWALSAAAVVVLSLGIGVIWDGEEIPEVGQDPLQVAAEEPIPEAWLWDDGLVAGAPVLDGLTDEQLEALIQEMER